MRRRKPLRHKRLTHAAVGASVIAIPPFAAALAEAATTPDRAQNADTAMQTKVSRHHIEYGKDVVIKGSAPSAASGQSVSLRFRADGTRSWRTLAAAQVGTGGRFRVAAPLHRSGAVEVIGSWQPQAQPAIASAAGGPPASASAATSAPQHVTVAAQLRLRPHAYAETAQQSLTVRGKLLSGVARHRVRVQALQGGQWRTLGSGRTGARGGFSISISPTGSGRERLRVLFAGDHFNGRVARAAGTVTFLSPSVASWYNDGGSTACGFHAYYGVANVSLPCGTHVTFSYGGRSVTAVVDDRGPYVGGRTWDLNQNTAAALGFGGVGTVWTSR